MGNALTLFRVAGIPVRVHVSWLVIYGLLAWSLSVGYFPHVLPDMHVRTHWVSGLVAALLLFVSVFVHELSHSVVARSRGLPVKAITLHIFGGVSELEREPDSPGLEFWMALAGPFTSFVLGGLAFAAAVLMEVRPALAAILRYLAVVNVMVGLFNLVPGFPLDGGRILRAALWRARGNLEWATRMASRAGSTFGLILMGLGVLRGLTGEFLGGLWFVLIGLFLRQAAEGSYRQLVLRRALGPLAVRDVMTREVVHMPPDLSVARAVSDYFWQHHVTSFPVVDGGRVVGLLSMRGVGGVPQDRWETTLVRDVMLPLTDALSAAPGDRVPAALDKLARNGLGRLAVLEHGQLAGYLSLKDVMHVLTVSTAGGMRPSPRRSSDPNPVAPHATHSRTGGATQL
jgi:Zn-dependent protease/predicted transcriptional regulator